MGTFRQISPTGRGGNPRGTTHTAQTVAAMLLALFLALAAGAACAPVNDEVPPTNELPAGTSGARDNPILHATGPAGAQYDALPFGRIFFVFSAAAANHQISLQGLSSDLSWELYDPFFTILLQSCDKHFNTKNESCTSAALEPPLPFGLAVVEWDNRDTTFTLIVD